MTTDTNPDRDGITGETAAVELLRLDGWDDDTLEAAATPDPTTTGLDRHQMRSIADRLDALAAALNDIGDRFEHAADALDFDEWRDRQAESRPIRPGYHPPRTRVKA